MIWMLMAATAMLVCSGMETKAAGGSSSLAVSSSSVNIGDTVTVTLNVSADVYASFRMSLSYSGSVLEYTGSNKGGDCNGGGGELSVLSEVNGGDTYSISCTFKAKAPGDASISASAVEAIAMETAEAISISGSGASVTVNNAASDNGGDTSGNAGNSDNGTNSNDGNGSGNENNADNGGTVATENLSADNSLKSLTISPGTLSPAFYYSTTKYTASVDANVASIAVDAQTSNEKATVESVTGNTNLQPGENTIKIVVKAENGTLATYTIMVNRGGTAEETEEEEQSEEETEEELPATGIVINGTSYEVSAALPKDSMPEEFTMTTVTYGEQEVEAYSFPYGDLKLFYLNPVSADEETEDAEAQTGGFFFYNAAADEFFPYINITVGQNYVLILPLSFSAAVPEGYQDAVVTMGGFPVNGYQMIQTQVAEEETAQADEFYLVYGVDKNGVAGWYQYDAADMSLQRYHETAVVTEEEEEPQADTSAYQEEYQKLETKYKKEKASSRTVIAVLIFLLIVAVIAIINILIFSMKGKGGRKRKEQDKDIDYIDFDDL